MLAAFGLSAPATQRELYAHYRKSFESLRQAELPPILLGAMLKALSEAYDAALLQTVEAVDAASSPRSPRRGEYQRTV